MKHGSTHSDRDSHAAMQSAYKAQPPMTTPPPTTPPPTTPPITERGWKRILGHEGKNCEEGIPGERGPREEKKDDSLPKVFPTATLIIGLFLRQEKIEWFICSICFVVVSNPRSPWSSPAYSIHLLIRVSELSMLNWHHNVVHLVRAEWWKWNRAKRS